MVRVAGISDVCTAVVVNCAQTRSPRTGSLFGRSALLATKFGNSLNELWGGTCDATLPEAYSLTAAIYGRCHGRNLAVNEETRSEIAALCEEPAWNMGSAEAFADRALPDIVFTNIFRKFSIGKAPFVAQHARIFSTIYRGRTNHLQIEHIKLSEPDVAIVDLLTVVAGVQHPPPGAFIGGPLHSRLERVLVRQGTAGGWRHLLKADRTRARPRLWWRGPRPPTWLPLKASAYLFAGATSAPAPT